MSTSDGFTPVRRFEQLSLDDEYIVRNALNELIVPDGREIVVVLGVNGDTCYFTDLEGLDTGWDDMGSEMGQNRKVTDFISAEIGHAPSGWLSDLPEFDGF